jgi:hypothetical protein
LGEENVVHVLVRTEKERECNCENRKGAEKERDFERIFNESLINVIV